MAKVESENQLIEHIPLNDRERIHISLSTFGGHNLIDLRKFYTTDGGETWLPTPKGISIKPEIFVSVLKALEQAGEAATEKGWVLPE